MIEILSRDGIDVLQMNHGPVNAMDLEFCRAMNHQLKIAASNDDCRAVVLRGNDRVFSAGIDLKRWLREPVDYVQPFLAELERLFQRVFSFPKPIVAMINGPAVAGGCMVAAACDYRWITTTASIGIPELRVGVPLPMLAIEIMRFVARSDAFQ